MIGHRSYVEFRPRDLYLDKGLIEDETLRKRPASLFAAALLSLALMMPVAAEAQSRRIKFIRDAEIESIIRAYATPLLQAAGLSPKDVDIYLIEDRAINVHFEDEIVAGTCVTHGGEVLHGPTKEKLS